MQTVIDVAAYILDKYGTMTTMKLEKLAFYSQAYCLVESRRPLFSEDFEAWVNGPVSPALYRCHRGLFLIHPGDLAGAVWGHAPLPESAKELIDAACSKLSTLTGKQLSELTHAEKPWADARRGYKPSDHCEVIINKASIMDYYAHHPTWRGESPASLSVC